MTLPLASVRKGLRFKCRGKSCNLCCTGGKDGGLVLITRKDERRIGNALAMADMREKDDVRAMWIPPGEPCVFSHPEKGCVIHDRRPEQCANYPWWRGIMLDKAAFEREKTRCPGFGEGGKPSMKVIKKALRKDKHTAIFQVAQKGA